MHSWVKRIHRCLILCVCAAGALTAAADDGGSFTVIVEAEGFESNTGVFGLGLYTPQHAAFFPSGTAEGQYFKNGRVSIHEKRVVFVFENVPYGTYAISAYHDENENGVLDRNFLGVPKEAWAVSNNVRHALTPPSFEEAQFAIGQGTTTKITLELN